MKAIITTLFLFVSLLMVKAQETEQNRFQQSENAATDNTNGSAIGGVGGEQEQGPGNPPGEDEIPIDMFLPTLAVIGTSLVIYKFKKKIFVIK